MKRTTSKSLRNHRYHMEDKRHRNTKYALLSSISALILCCAMLIGTTFAWFTDSVTSGKNKIVAGNLDVVLEYSTNGTDWTEVGEDTNMFDGALWEPGHTEVVYLKVTNKGSLALKYKLGINVADQVIGETADGKEIDLSQYIKFGVVDALDQVYASDSTGRTAARSAVESTAQLISAGYSSSVGHLAKETSTEKLIALVVYMPEDVGNEANYGTGKTAPEIHMGISLVATQDTVESDSFDENYDKNAVMPVVSSEEILAGLGTKNGYVILGSDIALTEPIYQSRTGTPVSIDLNGKTITTDFSAGTDAKQSAAIYYKGSLTGKLNLTGDGKIEATNGNYAVTAEQGTVNISGGTYIGVVTSIYVVKKVTANATINISGGFFEVAHDAGNAEQCKFTINQQDSITTQRIHITGGTFVNFDPSNNTADGEGTNYVSAGYKVISETQTNGDIWYTVVPE